MMTKLQRFIDKQNLYVTPRTRCKICGLTVAQIYREYGERGLLDARFIDDGDDFITAIDKSKAGWYCYPCLEYDLVEPKATVTLYSAQQDYHFIIGEYLVEEQGDEQLSGELFEQVIRPYAQQLIWHSTDPWRGYYGANFNTTWTKVIDSWFCPLDGHNIGDNDLGKFHELYETQKVIPDCNLLVAFPRTSNVFACGIEVYVPNAFIDTFKQWLGVKSLELEESKL